jgi:hypothetical protein
MYLNGFLNFRNPALWAGNQWMGDGFPKGAQHPFGSRAGTKHRARMRACKGAEDHLVASLLNGDSWQW